MAWVVVTFVFHEISGSIWKPPSHLRPGRQHVQKHDDRPREPVRHHQVRLPLTISCFYFTCHGLMTCGREESMLFKSLSTVMAVKLIGCLRFHVTLKEIEWDKNCIATMICAMWSVRCFNKAETSAEPVEVMIMAGRGTRTDPAGSTTPFVTAEQLRNMLYPGVFPPWPCQLVGNIKWGWSLLIWDVKWKQRGSKRGFKNRKTPVWPLVLCVLWDFPLTLGLFGVTTAVIIIVKTPELVGSFSACVMIMQPRFSTFLWNGNWGGFGD